MKSKSRLELFRWDLYTSSIYTFATASVSAKIFWRLFPLWHFRGIICMNELFRCDFFLSQGKVITWRLDLIRCLFWSRQITHIPLVQSINKYKLKLQELWVLRKWHTLWHVYSEYLYNDFTLLVKIRLNRMFQLSGLLIELNVTMAV